MQLSASRYQRRQTPIENVKSSAPDNEFWGSELDYSSDEVKSDGSGGGVVVLVYFYWRYSSTLVSSVADLGSL